VNYNVTHVINRAGRESYFKRRRDQMITKCVYNLFLAVEQICRIGLASFSDLQSVVYTSVYITFLNKFFA